MLYVLTRNDWCRSNLRVKVQVKLVQFFGKTKFGPEEICLVAGGRPWNGV
jgi:hypothetical protein